MQEIKRIIIKNNNLNSTNVVEILIYFNISNYIIIVFYWFLKLNKF